MVPAPVSFPILSFVLPPPHRARAPQIPECTFWHAVLALRMDARYWLDSGGDDLLAIAVRLADPSAVATIVAALRHAYDPEAGWRAMCALCRDGPAARDPPATEADVVLVVRCLQPPGVPGADPLRRDAVGMSPYLYCCVYGRIGVVQHLLHTDSCNVLPHMDGEHGWTGLAIAARFGRVDLVQMLVARDDVPAREATVNFVDVDGRTPLHHAAKMNEVNCVVALLAHSKLDVRAQDARGRTALHDACAEAHMGVVEAFNACGTEVLTTLLMTLDKGGQAPLQLLQQALRQTAPDGEEEFATLPLELVSLVPPEQPVAAVKKKTKARRGQLSVPQSRS